MKPPFSRLSTAFAAGTQIPCRSGWPYQPLDATKEVFLSWAASGAWERHSTARPTAAILTVIQRVMGDTTPCIQREVAHPAYCLSYSLSPPRPPPLVWGSGEEFSVIRRPSAKSTLDAHISR